MPTHHDERADATGAPDGSQLRLAEGVNYQPLGDGEDGVIVSLGSGFLYRCNHTAIVILDMLRDRPTVESLLDGFAARFQLAPEQARSDVLPLVRHLVEQKLVEKVA